jgi:hypothetical protein
MVRPDAQLQHPASAIVDNASNRSLKLHNAAGGPLRLRQRFYRRLLSVNLRLQSQSLSAWSGDGF